MLIYGHLTNIGYAKNFSIYNLERGTNFLMSTEEAEEEDAKKEYVEETNRDAVMIAAAKLIATDAVPKVTIASILLCKFVIHLFLYNCRFDFWYISRSLFFYSSDLFLNLIFYLK